MTDRQTVRGSLLAALLLLVPATAAPAQQEPAPARPAPIVSVDFQGGTLAHFLDVVRRTEASPNITASAMASEVPMPALSIQGATVTNVLAAAAAVAPQPYDVRCHESPGPGAPVYMVQVQERPQDQTVGWRPVRQVQVFSLRTLVDAAPGESGTAGTTLPVETVLSAVEQGVGMAAGDPPQLKYHGDSWLLFVSGSPEQIDVAQTVLQSLQQDQDRRRKALHPPAQQNTVGPNDRR